jgi:hypothetical protein
MPTTTSTDPKTPIPTTPPLNWRKEMPVYRVRVETRQAPKSRFRFEPPFASQSDSDVWQYGERIHKAGEVIETDQWPCAGTFVPLNYSAREVLNFFNSRQKSRLPRSPWADGRIRLSDGLSGAGPTFDHVAPPQVKSMDLRPVRF